MVEVNGQLLSPFPWCRALYSPDKTLFTSIFVICIMVWFHLWARHVVSARTVVQIYLFSETPLQLSFGSSEFEH
jgi:hypothetical protein